MDRQPLNREIPGTKELPDQRVEPSAEMASLLKVVGLEIVVIANVASHIRYALSDKEQLLGAAKRLDSALRAALTAGRGES